MELYTCVDDQEQGGGALWSWWKVEKERNEGMNFMMTTMVYVVYFLTVLHCIFFSFLCSFKTKLIPTWSLYLLGRNVSLFLKWECGILRKKGISLKLSSNYKWVEAILQYMLVLSKFNDKTQKSTSKKEV